MVKMVNWIIKGQATANQESKKTVIWSDKNQILFFLQIYFSRFDWGFGLNIYRWVALHFTWLMLLVQKQARIVFTNSNWGIINKQSSFS